MSKPTKVFLELSYCDVRYWYRFIPDDESLQVKLVTKVPSGLKKSYLKDAENEAYEHYNALHKDRQIIQKENADNGGY